MSEPPLLRAYKVPAALAFVSIGGLVVALVYDGIVDAAALCLIAIPLVVLARSLRRPLPEIKS